MYTIKNPYNKNKYSQLKLFKMIASGGAGQIYKTNLKNVVAKIYIKDRDKKLYEKKVLAMLLKPPKGIEAIKINYLNLRGL